tara:strand:- start:42 stop:389 length:348 start_codon:yes stop_codon:yes gene_type:complete
MSFYNTIEEEGQDLVQSYEKTKTQEEKILECFKSCKEPLSPSMVLYQTGLNCPITSVRRAMTDLSNNGKLRKTTDYTLGTYGKKEHLWTLPEVESQPESSIQSSLDFTNDKTHHS